MTDPIVAEIHQIRERIWAECHENPVELAQRLLRQQATLKDRLIDPEKWRKTHGKVAETKPSSL